MNFFKTKPEIKGQGSVVNCETGFTMTEMVVVMAMMVILISVGYSQLRTPKEKIACKEIFSNLQLAKLQAVSTGANVSVNVGSYRTVNISGNVTSIASVTWNEDVDYQKTAVEVLPNWGGVGVGLGFPVNGIDFDGGAGGTQVTFTSKGMAGSSGSVYLKDVNNTSRLCAVSVLTTGIVRMATSSDGGKTWN